MKWFLQFLSLGSAVLYTLLVIIDNCVPHSTVENTVISEAQSKQRRLSVWDPYLPYRSFGQDRQASLTTQPAHQQIESLAPEPNRKSPRQYFDGQPASDDKLTAAEIDGSQIGKRPASLPEEEIWFVVSRAARLHGGPSVSSPVAHLYPVGTELKLVAYVRGWFQVSDPATSRQGWIYEKYYLDAIRGPSQTRVAVQESPNAARLALAAQERKPVSRVKKPRPQQKITKLRSSRTRNEFASLIERAFRGY
jgi:hypothetical protein